MITNLHEFNKQAIESTVESKKMRLSANASAMVFQMFTKKVYSNPIGTIVREITSNCFDSHTEAKVNTPVIIRKGFEKETSSHYISFIDNGVGMSPDRIENVYSVYFESTKNLDNDQIGGFGIGGKTPLAYKRNTGIGESEYDNSFNIITKFDGIEYYYLIYEGADSPNVSLLFQQETTEHNGTEIRIPMAQKDIYSFENELVRQLYYFENIIFEGFDNSNVPNDYQIIQSKSFRYRGTKISSAMHVCLGKVAYPIDYNVLGMSSSDYNIPVAIKFEVGELDVTISREQLDYSTAAIKLLQQRLVSTKKEILEMLNVQYDNIISLKEYFDVKKAFGYLKLTDTVQLYVGNVITSKDVSYPNYKYRNINVQSENSLFKLFFNATPYGKKISNYDTRNVRGNALKLNLDGLKEKQSVYHIDGEFLRNNVKQAFIKSMYPTFHIIKKREIANADGTELENSDLGFKDNVLDVQLLLDMQDEYYELVKACTKDYDAVVVSEDFIENRKRKKLTSEIKNTTVNVSIVHGAYYPTKERVLLSHLFDLKIPIIYGSLGDETEMKNLVNTYRILFSENTVACSYSKNTYDRKNPFSLNNGKKDKNNFITGKKGIMFILLAQTNMKYVKYCYNALTMSEFQTKYFSRKAEYVKNYFEEMEIVNGFNNLGVLYRYDHFNKLSSVWGAKIEKINAHIKKTNMEHNSSIDSNSYLIHKYFPESKNITLSFERKRIIRLIEELKRLEEVNEPYLKYIRVQSLEYSTNACGDEFYELLLMVMKF